APAPAAAKSAPAPSPSPSGSSIYDQYKKDRGTSGQPKFEVAADVAADKQAEHVIIHDRDIVVFGKGFKGGTGYAYLSLGMFASSSDITEMTARDVTGDGKAEIEVRGILHANPPKEAGSGTVD